MELNIDIAQPFQEVFERRLGGRKIPGGFQIDPNKGTHGALSRKVRLPDGLEFYHFGLTTFKEPLRMITRNAKDSPWRAIHINLAHAAQEKYAGGKRIVLQKHLPAGFLVFGPNLEIKTIIPKGVLSEVCTLRFKVDYLKDYFPDPGQRFQLERNLIYEELDPGMEHALQMAIAHWDNSMVQHSTLLDFLNRVMQKITTHSSSTTATDLHPDDVNSLMKAAAGLRDPHIQKAPTIENLARDCNMSPSKFKRLFKMVFGHPVMAYRRRSRMEFARRQLLERIQSPTEISYELGFAHPSNFTAAYKSHFGHLPSTDWNRSSSTKA